MKIRDARIVIAVLARYLGWSLPMVLARVMLAQRRVFTASSWADRRDPESRMVKRTAMVPAIFEELRNRFGSEKALAIMREVLYAVVFWEQWEALRRIPAADREGLDAVRRFCAMMDSGGVAEHNRCEKVRSDALAYEVRYTRCLYFDFFKEAGVPELTRIFCETDHLFFPVAFPGTVFHRGDSPRNTIAFGKDHCDFVIESADPTG